MAAAANRREGRAFVDVARDFGKALIEESRQAAHRGLEEGKRDRGSAVRGTHVRPAARPSGASRFPESSRRLHRGGDRPPATADHQSPGHLHRAHRRPQHGRQGPPRRRPRDRRPLADAAHRRRGGGGRRRRRPIVQGMGPAAAVPPRWPSPTRATPPSSSTPRRWWRSGASVSGSVNPRRGGSGWQLSNVGRHARARWRQIDAAMAY